MKKKFQLISFLFLIPFLSKAQLQFELSQNCINAYSSISALKIKEGEEFLKLERIKNPSNALPILIQSYEDYYSLVLNDNPDEYKRLKNNKATRIRNFEKSNKKSPYYLFSKAVVYIQWAMIEIKYEDNFEAATDFRKAFLLFKENKKAFPDFYYNDIFLGAQESIIGTIPDGYKWITNILGLKGNTKSGMEKLEKATEKCITLFKTDGQFFYIYLKNYLENDSETALELIKKWNLDVKNNHLFAFMSSNLYLNNFNAKKAEQLIQNRNKSLEYMDVPMFDYELGCAKLFQLETTSARKNLLDYLNTSKSLFYKKDALLKIAYSFYLENNISQATLYKNKILKIGNRISDADKQAEKFARNGAFSPIELLKARLLSDGGDHKNALKIMEKIDSKEFTKPDEILEYNYRYARIYTELKSLELAKKYYQITISLPNPNNEYFPYRSLLQLGFIAEEEKNNTLALKYFNQVLNSSKHEYKNSFDQRAKSGIIRINGK